MVTLVKVATASVALSPPQTAQPAKSDQIQRQRLRRTDLEKIHTVSAEETAEVVPGAHQADPDGNTSGSGIRWRPGNCSRLPACCAIEMLHHYWWWLIRTLRACRLLRSFRRITPAEPKGALAMFNI